MTVPVKRKQINAPKITNYEEQRKFLSRSLRIVLQRGEAYRLPPISGEIHVISGHAWLTIASKDITLSPGEKVSIAPDKVFGLVSVLGNGPLIFDITFSRI